MRTQTVAKGILGSLALLTTACGSSSNEGIIVFTGSVTAPMADTETDRTALANVTVCALGACSLSNSVGQWSFEVDDDTFEGGDVLFTFQDPSINTSAVVPMLNEDSDRVEIDFSINPDQSVDILMLNETDDDSIDDEIDEFGEEIEDESDSAEDSFEEETDSAGDSIEEETDSAGDSIEEEFEEV